MGKGQRSRSFAVQACTRREGDGVPFAVFAPIAREFWSIAKTAFAIDDSHFVGSSFEGGRSMSASDRPD
jgi:hypothetical protein